LAHYISRQTQITIQYWRIFQQIKSSAGVKLEKNKWCGAKLFSH